MERNSVGKKFCRLENDLRRFTENMPDTCVAEEYYEILENLLNAYNEAARKMIDVEKPVGYYMWKLKR